MGKTTTYCKVMSLQFKKLINFFKKENHKTQGDKIMLTLFRYKEEKKRDTKANRNTTTNLIKEKHTQGYAYKRKEKRLEGRKPKKTSVVFLLNSRSFR